MDKSLRTSGVRGVMLPSGFVGAPPILRRLASTNRAFTPCGGCGRSNRNTLPTCMDELAKKFGLAMSWASASSGSGRGDAARQMSRRVSLCSHLTFWSKGFSVAVDRGASYAGHHTPDADVLHVYMISCADFTPFCQLIMAVVV